MIKIVKPHVLLVLLAIPATIIFMNIDVANAQDGKPQLVQQLNQLINTEPGLQGAIAGVSIRSAENGQIIYNHNGDVRLRPASNLKLLTAAAALNVLGENYTFSTEVLRNGSVKKKTLQGNLYLRGKGDPTLLKADFDQMAIDIEKRGIKKINGNLVGDDSRYDDIRYSLDLPWSDETTYYGAQISALSASPTKDYDTGSIKITVKPGTKSGDKVIVAMNPKTNYIKIINHAITVGEDGKKKIVIERKHAKNTITIKGTIPVKAKAEKEWIGVWDPTRYALTLFNQSLKKHGIKVTGKIRTGTVPDTANIVTSHQSMPLSQLLVPFLKLSNNVHAEMLVKEMGKVKSGEGSWKKGLPVMKAEMRKLGISTKAMVIRDGSGVSHVDLIPANQLTQLLFVAQRQKWFPSYLYSLPVAGIHDKMVGGTLRNRLKSPNVQGKVKAKTGTISTVSSISGFVNTKSGEKLIFSILLNNLTEDVRGKKIEDRMVQLIANS